MKKFFSRGINYCLVNITNLSSNKWKEVYIPYLYLGLSILLLFYQRLQQHHKEWSRSLQTVTKIKRIQPPTYSLQTPSERGAPPAPCLLGNFSKPRRRRRRPRPRERHQTKGLRLVFTYDGVVIRSVKIKLTESEAEHRIRLRLRRLRSGEN